MLNATLVFIPFPLSNVVPEGVLLLIALLTAAITLSALRENHQIKKKEAPCFTAPRPDTPT